MNSGGRTFRGNARGNLPAEVTTFVGRRQEMVEVRKLLSASRMITLTGPGGVGKTRLALAVARAAQRAFEDSAWLVEIAALRDASLLPHAVIDSLQVPEQSARSPMTLLKEHLRDRQLLLVLDNCEHILEGVAILVEELLQHAPGLRVLVTSREVLRVPSEHVMPVPPLPVPATDAEVSAEAMQCYESVALFAERAAAVVPNFKLTTDNYAAVTRLCRRLEGIPLAIELSTVRLRALPVAELVSRLDHRFELLTSGNRTVPARHQTLQATIDWSYELCTPEERTLWERASVFAGTFDLDAAEAVCSDDALPTNQILDTVVKLVDKSILDREEQAGYVRFRLLETIRDYGLARLRASGTEQLWRRRHRDWYLKLVEQSTEEWFGPRQQQWCPLLHVARANIRTALEFCLNVPGEERVALRLAGLPWFFWVALGWLTEGRYWLERGLAASTDPSHERAWGLGTYGYIVILQGDRDVGEAALEECRSLARELDDPVTDAYAAHLFGLSAMFSGELDLGTERMESAWLRYEAAGAPRHLVVVMKAQLGVTYLFQTDITHAYDLYESCRVECEEHGERWLLSYALWGLGFVEFRRGELAQAQEVLRESVRIKWFFHDILGLAMAVDLLAWTEAASGAGERAAMLLGAAGQLWHTFGHQLFGSRDFIAHREQCEERARALIGDRAYNEVLARGAELETGEAVAYAAGEQSAESMAAVVDQRAEVLTPREREIAELVASGMSNKEIAAKLVIAPRTAEGHVQNILGKLGFTGRAQIAAWVTQHKQSSRQQQAGDRTATHRSVTFDGHYLVDTE